MTAARGGRRMDRKLMKVALKEKPAHEGFQRRFAILWVRPPLNLGHSDWYPLMPALWSDECCPSSVMLALAWVLNISFLFLRVVCCKSASWTHIFMLKLNLFRCQCVCGSLCVYDYQIFLLICFFFNFTCSPLFFLHFLPCSFCARITLTFIFIWTCACACITIYVYDFLLFVDSLHCMI